MQFDFSKIDYQNERTKLVLKTAYGSVFGVIGELFDMQLSPSYNEISELSFVVPAFSHGHPTPFYEHINGMRVVELPGVGQFILQNPKITNNGLREVKECTAYSLEYETTYKNLNLAAGTYNLWNPADPSNTIIGMFMRDNPLWECPAAEVAVDADLIGRYRTFEISDNWYNFLKNTAQETYQCIFDFDTFRRRIIIRSAKSAAATSEVFISLNNLAKEIKVEENTDELFTCFDVNGADGVDIRSVNPGGINKIYNLDHFMTTEHFPQDIIDRWNNWKADFAEAQVPYYTLSIQNAVLWDQMEKLKTEMIELDSKYKEYENCYSVNVQAEKNGITPATPSEEYKRKMEEVTNQKVEKQAEYDRLNETHLTVQNSLNATSDRLSLQKAFTDFDESGNIISAEPWKLISGYIKETVLTESSFVVSEYDLTSRLSHLDNLNSATIGIIDSAVTEVEVPTKDRRTFSIHGGSLFIPGTGKSANIILSNYDILPDNRIVLSAYLEGVMIDGKYFPNSNLTITCSIKSFRTSDSELSFTGMNGTLYITNVATEFQQQSVKWELYEYGKELLEKSAHPNYTFEVDCANFLAEEDFFRFKNKLRLGQRIYLRLDEDTVLTPIVIGAQVNLHDPTDFSITFANKYNEKTGSQAVQDLLSKSVSMGSSLDANKLTYSAYKDSKANNAVENLIHDALDLAQKSIQSSTGQGLLIDDSGIKLRKRQEGSSPEDNLFEGSQVWMTNNTMLFVDANGNARLAIGEIGANFGIVADVIYGRLLAGKNVVISNDKGDGTVGSFKIDGDGITASNNAFRILFDTNGTSEEMSIQDYVAKKGTSVYKQETAPANPHNGWLWFSTSDQKWYRYNDPAEDGTGKWEMLTDGELSAIVKTENGETTVKLDSVRGAIDTTAYSMSGTKSNLVMDKTGLWLIDSDSPTTASKAVWMNGSGISLSNDRSAHNSKDPSYNNNRNNSFKWTTAISADGVFANKFIGNEIFGEIALGIGKQSVEGEDATRPFYVDANGKLHATGADISGTVNAEQFRINGKDALTKNDKISADYLDLKGLTIRNSADQTTFQIDSNGNVTINGGSISFSALDNLTDDINSLNSSLSKKMDINPKEPDTPIGPNWIYTGTLSADQITAGKIDANYLNLYGEMRVRKTQGGSTGGYIGYVTGEAYGNDGSVQETEGIGVNAPSGGKNYDGGRIVCTDSGARLTYGPDEFGSTTTIACVSKHCYSSEPMETFSDQRLKCDIIYDLDERFGRFFRALRPCRFKMRDRQDGPQHIGFIAQEMRSALEADGMMMGDLAALSQFSDEGEEEGIYTVKYGELTALNTAMMQQVMKRLDDLEKQLDTASIVPSSNRM